MGRLERDKKRSNDEEFMLEMREGLNFMLRATGNC